MRVFILTTGRAGSMTFERACRYITNFTCGHESKSGTLAGEQIDYPDNHIEVNNRLSWLLGRLDKCYGDDAYYVWLHRTPEDVVQSYARRRSSLGSIITAYCHGILKFPEYSDIGRLEVSRDFVGTVHANIESFLKDKSSTMRFDLSNPKYDFRSFWDWIGAQGDLHAALAEWDRKYNSTEDILSRKNRRPFTMVKLAKKCLRALQGLPIYIRRI